MNNHNHTPKTSTTGIWSGLFHSTFTSLFARSKYRGMIRVVNTPAEIPTGGLGAWHWERMFPASSADQTSYVALTVLDGYDPKHHGGITLEAIIAHMLVHVERGTQCTAADPLGWTDECKATHWEAMNRMGWSPWKCDSYDPETEEWIEYVPNVPEIAE